MKRIVDIDMTYRGKDLNKALDKFFKKYPHLEYWKEQFEYMAENNLDFDSDKKLADGTENKDWAYALHLDIEESHIYIAVIERA